MRRDLFRVATLENMIDSSAPAEDVCDFVVDVRNELRWNPQLRHVQMLTPDPLGAGTRFRATFGRGCRGGDHRGHRGRPSPHMEGRESFSGPRCRERRADPRLPRRLPPDHQDTATPPRNPAPIHPGLGPVDASHLGIRPAYGENPS
jgi:hypothetical protein